MIKLQKEEVEQKSETALWDEFARLSNQHFQLKGKFGNSELLCNLASLIRTVEEKINVEKLVVKD